MVLRRWRTFFAYALAVVNVLAAMVVARVLRGVDQDFSMILIVAVMCSALFGGLGPGLTATVLAAIVATIFFFDPNNSFSVDLDDYVRVVVFLGVAVVISYLQSASRRAVVNSRKAKEEAEAASRAKDHFLAVLSHELRTPLNPALVAVSAMETEAGIPASAREDLRLVRRNIELESRLIDDLLDVARLSRGKIQMRFETVDANDAIRDAVHICQDEARQKSLDVRVELEAQSYHVHADPARLRQVFWNLLRNAIKFTPRGGTISIRTHNEADGKFIAEVQDTGIGIDSAAMDKIFRPFVQGDASITGRFGGMGLGLAISRELMTLQQGELSATSEGKDHGSCFIVRMGTVDVPSEVQQPKGATPGIPQLRDMQPIRSRRLLLVDDHEDTLRLLARLLGRRGHQVSTAGSISEALHVASRQNFDVVISDLGLPDGSGLELMRTLRDLYRVPAIALSGYGAAEDIVASVEAGFRMHLTKPVDFAQLCAAIDELAESSARPSEVVAQGSR